MIKSKLDLHKKIHYLVQLTKNIKGFIRLWY